MSPPAYVLATPVRNELENLPRLLEDLELQTRPPAMWVVVDDGSDDGSRDWLEQAAKERDWMRVLPSPEEATEYLGGHIARIKGWGLEQAFALADAEGTQPDFGGVLDADLGLPPDHYERLLGRLEADDSLGVVSSLICADEEDQPKIESFQRRDLPRGATQFFRRTCLDAIGGLPPYPGYDGAANALAGLRGWKRELVVDLFARHRRPTATRYGAAQGYRRKGRYAWFLGLHPLLILGRTAAYSLRSPHAGGAYFLLGWLGDAGRRAPRCPNEELRRYYGRERLKENLWALVGRGPGFTR